nr:retrovirus-related Pol polyprotein from transposon TNT 1-94 [Tanacetum cinerariifolium]
MCEMFCQFDQKKREEKRIEEEQVAKAQNWKLPVCYDDDDDEERSNSLQDNIISGLPLCYAITPNELVDSLNMGDEHLDTILATESDEFIKYCVENLVPNPSESEGENGCDVHACFITFSNVLFDVDYEFDSSDDQSLSDEDFPKEIFSNPLFKEEIIPTKIDPHHFDVEFDLIESMLNHDSSIIPFSSKINSLLDEFAGELTLLKSIPPRIDKTDRDPEEDIRLIKRLLYDDSSPRPPKEFVSENSNADIESFSPSFIPVKDSDSRMKEIDLTFNPDDPMPPSIEDDNYDSERDVLIREEFLDNYSLSLLINESFHFDISSFFRPPAKPPDGNTGILNIKMMSDNSEQKAISGTRLGTEVLILEKAASRVVPRNYDPKGVRFLIASRFPTPPLAWDRSWLRNFIKKFTGTLRFENDHFGAIMGYGDYVIGRSVIFRVYYMEGLGHNLFFVGQFCDSDLEITFRKHSCYVRDMDGVELIKAVATAYYIQNRSLIHTRHNKTPYELVHNKKPDLTFLCVFGALYYPTNDSEDLGKLQTTADIGIFVGYAPSRNGYRIYNKRTRRPAPTFLMPGQISSGLVPNLVPAAPYVPPTNKDLEILFQPMFDEYLEPPRVDKPVYHASAVPVSVNSAGTPSSTAIDQDAPSPSHSPSSSALQSPCLYQGVAAESTLLDENLFALVDKDPFINIFAPKPTSAASSSEDASSANSTYVT